MWSRLFWLFPGHRSRLKTDIETALEQSCAATDAAGVAARHLRDLAQSAAFQAVASIVDQAK